MDKKRQQYANKKQPQKSANKDNSILQTDFVDLEELMKQLAIEYPDYPIKCSLGQLSFDTLTEKESKFHTALYTSYDKMPSILSNKKFDGGKAIKLIKQIEEAMNFCINKGLFDYIPKGSFVTAELMGFQNPKYNKNDGKIYVAIHDQMFINMKGEQIEHGDLKTICKKFPCEGFVVKLQNPTPDKQICFKIKHKCFPSTNPEKPNEDHELPNPKQFTESGLEICNGNDYSQAVIPNINEQIIIAEQQINTKTAQLCVIPSELAIKKQIGINNDNQTEYAVFNGEKMKNLFVATGQGNTYMYTDNLLHNVLDQPLELQLKFDGETIILHKDINNINHLMVKLNIYVFLVAYPDGEKKYRLGWKKQI